MDLAQLTLKKYENSMITTHLSDVICFVELSILNEIRFSLNEYFPLELPETHSIRVAPHSVHLYKTMANTQILKLLNLFRIIYLRLYLQL